MRVNESLVMEVERKSEVDLELITSSSQRIKKYQTCRPRPEYSASSTTFNFRVPMVSSGLAVIWSYAGVIAEQNSICSVNSPTDDAARSTCTL